MSIDYFVNREKEIEQIEQAMGEWDTLRILCISGPGGIGKTSLLEHIRDLWPSKRQERARLLITRRIDFDDPSLHISETLGRTIAAELGETYFEPYIRQLMDWRRLEMAGISKGRLADEGEKVDQAFVESFARASKHRRVVLLMDTTEKIYSTDVWFYDLKLASQLCNTVVILSGREGELFDNLAQQMGTEQIQHITLCPFDNFQSEKYLQHRQRDMPNILLDEGTSRKILALARGNLLLIDLTLAWLSRQVPVMRWLNGKSLEEIQSLVYERPDEWQRVLISPISKTSTDRDRLLLTMALIDPMDKEMCRRLFGWSDSVIEGVWKDVTSLHFVKQLPGEQLRLHDVVRDMIVDRIRFEIDLEREHLWTSNAIDYLDELRTEWRQEIKSLRQREREAREREDNQEAWDIFTQLESAERKSWVFDGQYLGYSFLHDPQKAMEVFEKMWREATAQNRLSYRGVLISQLQQFEKRLLLSEDQKYQIDLRRAQHFLDHAMYEEAQSLLEEILHREVVQREPNNQIVTLIQLGNVVIRLGQFKKGYDYFRDAESLGHQHNLTGQIAQILNALGWVSRLMGQIERAAEYYRQALKIALKIGDKHREASALNNMAWVYALLHKYQSALALCHQSIAKWKELGMRMGLAASYGTLGEVMTEFGDYDKALEAYQQALDIYEESKYQEGLAGVYCGRGATFWLMGRLDEATRDLEKAREMGLKRFEPALLHRLAHVYLDRGDTKRAVDMFKQSYDISLKVADPFYELNSLGDLAKIAISEKEFQSASEFETRWQSYQAQHEGIEYPLPKALMLTYLGGLYLGEGNINRAIAYYLEGFPILATAGTYEPYTLMGQSKNIEESLFPSVEDDLIRQVGAGLENAWLSDEHLFAEHPEILPLLTKWKRWKHTGREAL